MPSRIDIGPEGGPFVAINENSNNLELQDINGNVIAKWDETAGQWDLNNNSLTGINTINASSVDTEQTDIFQVKGSLGVAGGSSQSIDDSSITKVEWSSVEREDGDVVSVDDTDDNITVLKDGLYAVNTRVAWNSDADWSTGDSVRTFVYVNGSREIFNRANKAGTDAEERRAFGMLDLSANDVVDVRVEQRSGSSISLRQDAIEEAFTFEVVKIA